VERRQDAPDAPAVKGEDALARRAWPAFDRLRDQISTDHEKDLHAQPTRFEEPEMVQKDRQRR
jgi:hypothetical protein